MTGVSSAGGRGTRERGKVEERTGMRRKEEREAPTDCEKEGGHHVETS